MPVDRWQWVAPDGRRGAQERSRAQAILAGVREAASRSRKAAVADLDPGLATILWASMERAGWRVEAVGP